MNAAIAAAAAAGATYALWQLARWSANARGIAIGRLPAGVPGLGATVAAIAPLHAAVDAGAIAVIATVAVAAVVDARSGVIFDSLTIALGTAAIVAAVAHGTAPAAIAGGLLCGGALLALHISTTGRGIGLGDVKLAAGIGAGLGAPLGACALGAAFIGGGAFGTWLLATHRARRGDRVRFAPFLAGGTAIALFGCTVIR